MREKLRKRKEERSSLPSLLRTSPRTHQAQAHSISHQSWTGGLISPEQLLEVQGAMMWGWAAIPIIPWGCWAVGPHSATIGDTNTVSASLQCCTVREMRVTAPPLSPGLSLPESSSPGP